MAPVLGNLPEETTSFVGRRPELARVDHALGTHRLITLTGPGGVGKSRLALRAARHAAPRHSDGVWWADIAPLRDDQLLVATVSDAVDFADYADHARRMPAEALCEWLQGKQLLLVLDSCERLAAACGHLVAELLTTAPGLTVLATSRQPLGSRGEYVLDVPPLPLHGPDGAAALFRDRARRYVPGLALDGSDSTDDPAAAEAVDAICARLEGVPLALELACAQLSPPSGDPDDATSESHSWGPADSTTHADSTTTRPDGTSDANRASDASRTSDADGPTERVQSLARRLLTSPLDVLAQDGTWPPRHRALRTAIGWSHEMCTPLERLLWARLSVFRGDFEEAEAREVCAGGPLDGDEVSRTLYELVRKSVVRKDRDLDPDGEEETRDQHPGPYTREGNGAPRPRARPPEPGPRAFRMLDTLREYGAMWLRELGEAPPAAARHAAYYADLVRRAEENWLGPQQADWYRRVGAAHADLCAALDHYLEAAPERALEMAGRVGFFWGCCGHLPEARSYLTRALELHSAPGPHRSRALWALGFTATVSGDQDSAKWLGEQCAVAAWQAKDPEDMLAAAYLLGVTHLMAGRPLAAHTLTDRALAARPGEPFDSPSQLRCRFVRTYALTALGRLDEAHEEAHALRELCAEHGEVWTRSYAEYALSLIALLQGRPDEAAGYARAMLDSKHLIGDSYGTALGLDLLAAALAYGGSGEEAARVYGLGQSYWSRVGQPQRGTPELAPVREECERRARAGIGDAAYERAYAEGLAAHPDSTLTLALLRPHP